MENSLGMGRGAREAELALAKLKQKMRKSDPHSWRLQWEWFCSQSDLKKAVLISSREALGFWHEGWPRLWWQKAWHEFKKNPNLWLYFWWDPKTHSGGVGLSPEVLFVSDEPGVYQSMAVAGTWSPGDSLQEKDLLKLKREHQLVVDDLLNKIKGQVAVRLSSPEVFAFSSSLQHWRSVLEWRTCEKLDKDGRIQEAEHWRRILHPTAAVGLLSDRTERWRSLAALPEHATRLWYGAPLIIASAQRIWAPVMIRGIFWQGTRVFYFAGGGVLPESEPDKEWQELTRKLDWMERVFF